MTARAVEHYFAIGPLDPGLIEMGLMGEEQVGALLRGLAPIDFDALGAVLSARVGDEGGAKLRVVLRKPPFDVQELGIRRALSPISTATCL
jgi:hypothetical protein